MDIPTSLQGLWRYRYERLEDDGTHIRLLEVTDEGPDDPLRCQIRAFALEAAPDYKAISYTWGEQRYEAPIIVNGAMLSVGQTCERTLRQARRTGPGYYWSDRICIDQENIPEKNRQVRLMREVFKQAASVLACVGDPIDSDDGQLLLDALQEHQLLFVKNSGQDWERQTLTLDESLEREALAKHNAWLLWMPTVDLRRLALALHSFLERPYFYRVWIIQELFLAKEVLFCCGTERFPLQALNGLRHTLLDGEVRLDARGLQHIWGLRRLCGLHGSAHQQVRRALQSQTTPQRMLDRGTTAHRGQYAVLEGVPRVMQGLRCFDPKDTLYGALGLLHQSQADTMNVDYATTEFSVALDFIRCVDDRSGVDLHVIEILIDNLGIGTKDRDRRLIRHAIEARRMDAPFQPSRSDHNPQQYPRKRTLWKAFDLRHSDNYRGDAKGDGLTIFAYSEQTNPHGKHSAELLTFKAAEGPHRTYTVPGPALRCAGDRIVGALPILRDTSYIGKLLQYKGGGFQTAIFHDAMGSFSTIVDFNSLQKLPLTKEIWEVWLDPVDLLLLVYQERAMRRSVIQRHGEEAGSHILAYASFDELAERLDVRVELSRARRTVRWPPLEHRTE